MQCVVQESERPSATHVNSKGDFFVEQNWLKHINSPEEVCICVYGRSGNDVDFPSKNPCGSISYAKDLNSALCNER